MIAVVKKMILLIAVLVVVLMANHSAMVLAHDSVDTASNFEDCPDPDCRGNPPCQQRDGAPKCDEETQTCKTRDVYFIKEGKKCPGCPKFITCATTLDHM